jgi:hypothetical protein
MITEKRINKSLFLKIYLICFVSLFILVNIGLNTEQSSSNCQGFTPLPVGCRTNNEVTIESTGHGFPLNDLAIHSKVTVNGISTYKFKVVDEHNLIINLIVDGVVAAIIATPIFVIYRAKSINIAKRN